MKPYVISAELELMGDVIDVDRLDEFRSSLTADLTSVGKCVEWVPTRELVDGLNSMIEMSSAPVISMDGRYVRPEMVAGQIALSRAVNESLQDVGYDSRINAPSVSSQLDEIGERFTGQSIALADDILFSGGIVCWVAEELRARGVIISTLLAGVAIGEGVAKLEAVGLTVQAVRTYDKVDDEICERDLTLTPGSGRKIAGRNLTALYFDPVYGRPTEWASLPPDSVERFCVNSLRRAAALLQPGVQMEELGSFAGYALRGDAQRVISERLDEAGYELAAS